MRGWIGWIAYILIIVGLVLVLWLLIGVPVLAAIVSVSCSVELVFRAIERWRRRRTTAPRR
jgi:uncharacterized membrane protein YesL